jgi:hypothetical protein
VPSISWVFGQQTVKGRIVDENLDEMSQARIYYKDTVLLGETDFNGFFEINIPKNTTYLSIGFIGYETAIVSIPDSCKNLEVILLQDSTYHYNSRKKIDRLRKKEFDKLPELHRAAKNKGLFAREHPCYQREFEPIKSRLDEISKHIKAKKQENSRRFKALAIGDTIRIPFSGTFRSDGTDRTSLTVFSYVVSESDFKCLIEGVVLDKNKHKNGHNIVYRITSTNLCKYDSIIYNNKDVLPGEVLTHNMKYFKILTK